jgi:hypothetical protein
VWAALEKVSRRSALGLRMELLGRFGDPGDRRHRTERLRLLAGFLDDAEVRDTKAVQRFDGPCAGFTCERIEVRDFVPVTTGRLLGIEVPLKLDRTPAEWAKVREDLRAALNKELAGPR